MTKLLSEFITTWTPRVAARAIEECAQSQGNLNALVVPWESDRSMLSMAVTLVKSDGWAVEHTNLGTIRLAEGGSGGCRVTILADPPNHPDRERLAGVFVRFVGQIRQRLEAVNGARPEAPEAGAP